MRKRRLPGVVIGAAAGAFASVALADDLPVGPNRELVYQYCETCHSVKNLVDTGGMSRSQWAEKLSTMETYGLQIEPDQKTLIVEYLAIYLAPRQR
jgi:hypothetical protein